MQLFKRIKEIIMKLLSKMLSFNLIRDGEDGEPGKPGESSYMFIRYSIFKDGLNSDGRTQMTDYPTPESLYIGLATVNINSAPVKAQNYTWSKYVGDVGDSGPMPINAGQWNKDTTYIKDSNIQPYVWQMHDGEKFFYLLVADKSQGDDPYKNNTEGSGNIWRYNENYNLLLARKIRADEIDVSNLIVNKLQTSMGGPRIIISGSEMHIYGLSNNPNIIFGVNEQGYAVLSYYDNNGKKLYDLGPDGLSKLQFAPQSWSSFKLTKIMGYKKADEVSYFDLSSATDPFTEFIAPEYHNYYAGGDPTISDEEKAKELYLYKSKDASSDNYIDDGWYYKPVKKNHSIPEIFSQETNKLIKPEDNAVYPNYGGVYDRSPIYYMPCYLYKGGYKIASKKIIWNGEFDGNQSIPRY